MPDDVNNEVTKIGNRKRASDFDPRLLELYDGYVHGKMTKRDFLANATKYVAAGMTATAVL